MRDFIGRYRCIHSKIYYYHTLAEAKEKIIVELYLLPDFHPVSGEGGSRIEDSAVFVYRGGNCMKQGPDDRHAVA